MTNEKENEKLVRAFYEATVPRHRESLRSLQSPHVIYDLPEVMPIGCGHFEGLQDALERFLARFYAAFDVRFAAEEFIAAGDTVVAIGRVEGRLNRHDVVQRSKTGAILRSVCAVSHLPGAAARA